MLSRPVPPGETKLDQTRWPADVSRRKFLGGTAAAALAAPFAKAVGANDKITVGIIGTGIRGSYLLERFFARNKETATVTAICDAYTGNVAKSVARVQTLGGNAPKTYADYRELLQDKSIDAVFIATPEHLHCSMLIDALRAGKHVYAEKPLAHTIEEGEKILKAAENSQQVVQVGTQNRSNSLYIKAKEMVAAGMIGEVHYTRAFWYRNSLDDAPAWRYAIPADANERNTDWLGFLGNAPQRPFSKPRFFQWRLYWDYSGGISTDLLVHQTDITQFVLSKTAPVSCMASGAILRWTQDDRCLLYTSISPTCCCIRWPCCCSSHFCIARPGASGPARGSRFSSRCILYMSNPWPGWRNGRTSSALSSRCWRFGVTYDGSSARR